MSAGSDIEPNRAFRGIAVALLDDGREVHVDDITDLVQGQEILDEVEAAIIRIESQLFEGTGDPEWRKRATFALKRKRAVMNRIQQRLGEFRRAARLNASASVRSAEAARVDAKRQVFVHAAYELLGHEACTEIWARAQEMKPDVFADQGGAA